ncbi:MAG: PDZ domain-containing protein [Ruminococcaceae bacterium]|nr:PDZ domain-containing protein [Oscillospiraceae bacterium]
MRKNRLHAILSVLLIFLLLCSLSLSSCARQAGNTPILQDEADAIALELDALIASKANALDTAAAGYEASGEVLKDENGNGLDMSAYIADLRGRASLLRTLTYRPYALAIMDDLYAREYIGVYRSVRSLLPAMVDILAKDILLDRLTDEEITTDALITCYTLALGDIYASYVDSETATAEHEMPTSYVGIGVSVTPRDDGYIDVISVTKGSPAEAGGILPGDILLAIEGDDISDIDYNQVVALVRGEADTSITMTFSRDGVPYTVTLVRRVVESVTVEYKILSLGEGTTGYIRISEFSAGTFAEFVNAIETLEANGAEEFVFDVRSNPGGNAEVVIAILEYILPDDITLPIVRFDSRDGSKSFHSVEEYLSSYDTDAETLAKFEAAKNHELSARIAVLCNEYTASAGELFTSCLMDFGVAETYGVTTYGKGLGQSSFRVSDYYAYAELGIQHYTYFEMGYFVIPAFYYSPPVSANYHDKGVVPHHELTLSEEAQDYYISTIPEALDNQLAAAVDFVQGTDPYTPPPVSGDTQSPSPETEKEGFFSSNSFLFIIFGVLFAGVAFLIAYLITDYRRCVKQQSTFKPWDDPKNDN